MRRNWGLIIAILAPVLTVITVVIPLVADAGVRLTSADSLVVGDSPRRDVDPQDVSNVQASISAGLASRELFGESDAELYPDLFWRLPVDAPWETLPLDPDVYSYFCTPAQISWLEEWGRRDIADVWGGYLSLNNSAIDGAAMSVRNIRSVGTFTEPDALEVSVNCASARGGASEIIPLRQELGSDSPAVFELDYEGAPAGTLATLNIGPGEYLQVVVTFDQEPDRTSDFVGTLVADLVVNDTTTEVALFEGFTRGGVAGIRTTMLTIGGHLTYCGLEMVECSVAQFVAELEADPAYEG